MSNYDNTNSFALFKNDKQGNDKKPDYTGKINVNGHEMEMAAWIRKSKSGTTFMSGKISEFQTKTAEVKKVLEEKPFDTFDDDLPF